jgi:hypothetical protein
MVLTELALVGGRMRRSIWHGSAGRVMVELLYGVDGIDRDNLAVHVDRAAMTARLYLPKDKLEKTLEWLQGQGLIADLEIKYKSFKATLKPITNNKAEIKVHSSNR